ncbi:MAG: DUF1330 domain-containing protein [Dehalococcoidia bacterium]|nr:DUF1330 domain-containing protein [Dehalococcoidia bacterium]
MAGYLIVDNQITDQDLFDEYASKIVGVMDAHGGKYLVRGGDTEVIEGDRIPHRVVVIEFESVERVRACVNSSEYLALADLRGRSSVTTTFIVEGV